MIRPHFHAFTPSYPVASGQTIKAGQVVMLNSTGKVVISDGTKPPIGLSADTKSTLSAGQFTNRVPDYGDETAASGKISVYQGAGGMFYVDLTDVVDETSVAINDILVATAGGKLEVNNSATSTLGGTGVYVVGRVVDIPSGVSDNDYLLPTGIPGEFEPSGDSDNPRKWILIRTDI
jgi:hypothetical protein